MLCCNCRYGRCDRKRLDISSHNLFFLHYFKTSTSEYHKTDTSHCRSSKLHPQSACHSCQVITVNCHMISTQKPLLLILRNLSHDPPISL
ncbi:hypothetical protein M758_1G244100 [Ceratodon purpureus]|nr:hypothetical protein M758_1G244100 [Ceratodon purpureus]